MQQASTKRIKEQTRLGEKGDSPRIVQKFDHTDKLYIHKPEKMRFINSWRFWHKKRSSNPGQKTKQSINQQEEKNLPSRGFCHSIWSLSEKERKWKETNSSIDGYHSSLVTFYKAIKITYGYRKSVFKKVGCFNDWSITVAGLILNPCLMFTKWEELRGLIKLCQCKFWVALEQNHLF